MTFDFQTTSEQVGEAFSSEIKNKIVLITGCTWGGLGAYNALSFAQYGAKLIIIAGRTGEKLEETIANIKKEAPEANIRPLILDLGSFKSVRNAAKEVNDYPEISVDILINSAGLMGCPYGRTENGFETHFGTNHLGHFLFTNLIMKKLLSSSHPHVINVTSAGHHFAPVIFEDPGFSDGAKYEQTGMIAYGQSKTANILFSRELSKRFNKSHGLVSFSVHPGMILGTHLTQYTDVTAILANPPNDYWGNPKFAELMEQRQRYKTLSEGASTALVASLDPSIVTQSGSYLADCQVNEELCAKHAKSLDDAAKLWALSEQLVGESF